jgi:hypothetical protein
VRRSMGPARIRGRDDSRSANGVHATASTPSDQRDGRQGRFGHALCACSIGAASPRGLSSIRPGRPRETSSVRLFLAASVARLQDPAPQDAAPHPAPCSSGYHTTPRGRQRPRRIGDMVPAPHAQDRGKRPCHVFEPFTLGVEILGLYLRTIVFMPTTTRRRVSRVAVAVQSTSVPKARAGL